MTCSLQIFNTYAKGYRVGIEMEMLSNKAGSLQLVKNIYFVVKHNLNLFVHKFELYLALINDILIKENIHL